MHCEFNQIAAKAKVIPLSRNKEEEEELLWHQFKIKISKFRQEDADIHTDKTDI